MSGSRQIVEQGFRGPQVCALAGITYRQLDYWARSELLRPSIADAAGSGSARRYSALDVRILRVLAQLGSYGASMVAIRRCRLVECLRALTPAEWADGCLVLTGDGRCITTVTPVASMDELGLALAWIVNLAAVPEPTLDDLREEVLNR